MDLERFQACAREAWGLAAAGRVEAGFRVLDLGLTWAETPILDPSSGEERAPEPWSAQLTTRYQQELARYIRAHGPALGTACAVRRSRLLCANSRELRATARSIYEDVQRVRARLDRLPKGPGRADGKKAGQGV